MEFEKLGILGLGLLALTQEKVEELLKELEDKGEISREEGKKIAKEALAEREKIVKAMDKKITLEVERTFKKLGIATRKDIEALNKRIAKLEKSKGKLKK